MTGDLESAAKEPRCFLRAPRGKVRDMVGGDVKVHVICKAQLPNAPLGGSGEHLTGVALAVKGVVAVGVIVNVHRRVISCIRDCKPTIAQQTGKRQPFRRPGPALPRARLS